MARRSKPQTMLLIGRQGFRLRMTTVLCCALCLMFSGEFDSPPSAKQARGRRALRTERELPVHRSLLLVSILVLERGEHCASQDMQI